MRVHTSRQYTQLAWDNYYYHYPCYFNPLLSFQIPNDIRRSNKGFSLNMLSVYLSGSQNEGFYKAVFSQLKRDNATLINSIRCFKLIAITIIINITTGTLMFLSLSCWLDELKRYWEEENNTVKLKSYY